MCSITLSICICTSGRPAELARCLESIKAGTRLADEVIVSDDSRENAIAEQIKSICGRYSFVKYVEGPRRGLCANRNHVVRQAQGTHVSLLDDDACVGAEFVARAVSVASRFDARSIVTGDVLENGTRRLPPTNPTFLGHFGRMYKIGSLRNINLNCNVVPRRAFKVGCFDERITYGYEDMDLCAQLLSKGFEIVHDASLTNLHFPPARSASQQQAIVRQAERARFFTTLRRYLRWERNAPLALAFIIIAPVHFALGSLKRRSLAQVPLGWRWLSQDLWNSLR